MGGWRAGERVKRGGGEGGGAGGGRESGVDGGEERKGGRKGKVGGKIEKENGGVSHANIRGFPRR